MTHGKGDILKLTTRVDEFSGAMIQKLTKKCRQGWFGWDDPSYRSVIVEKLECHVDRLKNDYTQAVDVANLAMFLFFMGERVREEGVSDE